jgi:hypothetical protein
LCNYFAAISAFLHGIGACAARYNRMSIRKRENMFFTRIKTSFCAAGWCGECLLESPLLVHVRRSEVIIFSFFFRAEYFSASALRYFRYVTLILWLLLTAIWLQRMEEAIGLYDPLFIIPLLQVCLLYLSLPFHLLLFLPFFLPSFLPSFLPLYFSSSFVFRSILLYSPSSRAESSSKNLMLSAFGIGLDSLPGFCSLYSVYSSYPRRRTLQTTDQRRANMTFNISRGVHLAKA